MSAQIASLTESQLRQAFEQLDPNGDGFITHKELKHVMLKLDSSIADSDIDKMIKEVDSDRDGQISYKGMFKDFNAMII